MNMQEMSAFITSSAASETRDSIKDLVELQKQQIGLLNQILTEEKGNLGQLKEERYKLEFEEDSQSIGLSKKKPVIKTIEERINDNNPDNEIEEIAEEMIVNEFQDEIKQIALELAEGMKDIENSKGIFEKNYNDKIDEAIEETGIANKLASTMLDRILEQKIKEAEEKAAREKEA